MESSGIPPLQPGVEILTPADDGPLTNALKNDLSKRLTNDWKKFARGTELFSETSIENLDIDEHDVVEKCYEMLSQWEKNSVAQVTIGMVKLNLINIKRNDILLDVFEITYQSGPSSISSVAGASNISVSSFSEPTISDLLYKHMQKLSNLLDGDQGIVVNNWKQLGLAVFQGDHEACDLLESFHLSYGGGGSPSKRLLTSLSQRYPLFSVKQFRNIAVKHQRMDVATHIDAMNCEEDKQLRDLTFDQKEKIIRDLDKDIRGIADWRTFADAVGYTNDEINEFRLAVRERNEYSPTQSLIDLMRQRYPLLSLSKVQMAASHIGRNDVSQYLGSIIDDLARSRIHSSLR